MTLLQAFILRIYGSAGIGGSPVKEADHVAEAESHQKGGDTGMLRTILTATGLIVMGLCVAIPAFAQEMTVQQREACMGDYEKYCKGTMPGGGRIIACLAKQGSQLKPACQKVVADAQQGH